MNGTALAVHQSSRRIEKRKLVSITRSPSVAVVSLIAPRWTTASSLRPFSQSASCPGGTMSASCRLARLRHLPSWPSRSHTTTSLRPASFNAATTFDPIKPAPPVTSSMPVPALWLRISFAPLQRGGQPALSPVVKIGTGFSNALRRFPEPLPPEPDPDPRQAMNNSSIHSDPTDTRPILIVPYMWIGDFVRGHTVVRVLNERWPNR